MTCSLINVGRVEEKYVQLEREMAAIGGCIGESTSTVNSLNFDYTLSYISIGNTVFRMEKQIKFRYSKQLNKLPDVGNDNNAHSQTQIGAVNSF